MTHIKPQIQEAQRTISKVNTKEKSPPWHIRFKLQRIKDKVLKEAKEEKIPSLQRTRVRITADFSSETMQAREEWSKIFKVLKEKNKKLANLEIYAQ